MTTTTYKLKGDCVVIVHPYRGWRYLPPDEARQLADEYEAAIPQLRALADQAEANAREEWERKEAEIDRRPRGAGKAKRCPECAAIQDAGRRVEEEP